MEDPVVYRRRSRSPFRVVGGRCLIGGVGEPTVAVGGSAVLVWIALDEPRTIAGLATEIRSAWPELAGLTSEDVQVSLTALLDEGLVRAVVVAGG